MSLQYILGREGQGQSELISQEIALALKSKEDANLILLVPEQFTLQSERDLIENLGQPGIIKVQVLSFQRMAFRVLSEVGGLTRIPINEQGKHMVLKRIVDNSAGDLLLYKKAVRQAGFISLCSDFISNLKRYDIDPGELTRIIEDMDKDDIISRKLRDIALIYERFNQYLEGRYLDTDDAINLLIEKIDQTPFLKDARIWIDGFNFFTPQERRIIEKIMGQAQEISISLTMDLAGEGRDTDLFALGKRSYMQIHALAQKQGWEEKIINISRFKISRSTRKPELCHLERELYAYPPRQFFQALEGIEVYAAANPYSEVESVAAQVLVLAREKGYRWRDIAIITNDMETYGRLIERIFAENDIPCFLDQRRSIMGNPIIRSILSALDIVQRGYRYEDIFSFLKTGFSKLGVEEIEKLENYTLRYGIRGTQWKEELLVGDEGSREEMNRYRESFILPLINLEKRIKESPTCAEKTQALYHFLVEIGLREQLSIWIEDLWERDRYEYVNENAQIWNIVLEIFEQLASIMGDQVTSLPAYNRILEAGFESYEMGVIPPTIDQVLVGDISRSKSHPIKALFLLGVNDGILPAGQDPGGILSAEEKQYLNEKGMDFGPDREMSLVEEKLQIYAALSKPTDYLWISFALADGEGRALRPSLLIEFIKKIFPRLKVCTEIKTGQEGLPKVLSSPRSTFKQLVTNLRSHLDGNPMDDFWWEVYQWFDGQETWQELKLTVGEGFFYQNQILSIGPQRARALYHSPMRSSISRLEQFAQCPFAHFIKYGLKPRERKAFVVEAPDTGELLHQCLAKFAEKMGKEEFSWQEVTREECEGIVDDIMDEMLPQYGYGVFFSTYRYKYLARQLKRIAQSTAWAISEQIQGGDFEPRRYEVRFGGGGTFPAIEIELENGEVVYLEGRIDRLDLWSGEDADYVRVIDYKSGNQRFSLSDVYNGLSLQLIIYLKAIIDLSRSKSGKSIKPAGVFYFKIDDPLVKSDQGLTEHIEKEIRKKFRMPGLVLKDVNIVRRLDRKINGHSELIPVALTKEGQFYRGSSALAEADFLALIQHAEDLTRGFIQRIMAGNIMIYPARSGRQKACGYCLYKTICQFDTQMTGNNYRNIPRLNNEEVIKLLAGKGSGIDV